MKTKKIITKRDGRVARHAQSSRSGDGGRWKWNFSIVDDDDDDEKRDDFYKGRCS